VAAKSDESDKSISLPLTPVAVKNGAAMPVVALAQGNRL
jgi:hypothetical protein